MRKLGTLRVNDLLEAWVVSDETRSTTFLQLVPVNPARYFKGRMCVELTPLELESIVTFVKEHQQG